jgi:glycogen operon protein
MVWLNGGALALPGPQGERLEDDEFLLLFNANNHPIRFSVPKELRASKWRKIIDTSAPDAAERDVDLRRTIPVPGFTVLVLQRHS